MQTQDILVLHPFSFSSSTALDFVFVGLAMFLTEAPEQGHHSPVVH